MAAIGAISMLKETRQVRKALKIFDEERDSFFTLLFPKKRLAAVLGTWNHSYEEKDFRVSDQTNTEER